MFDSAGENIASYQSDEGHGKPKSANLGKELVAMARHPAAPAPSGGPGMSVPMKPVFMKLVLVVCAAAILTACGGGGGKSASVATVEPPVVEPPVVEPPVVEPPVVEPPVVEPPVVEPPVVEPPVVEPKDSEAGRKAGLDHFAVIRAAKAAADQKVIDDAAKAAADQKVIDDAAKAAADQKVIDDAAKAAADQKVIDDAAKAAADQKVIDDAAKAAADQKVIDDAAKAAADQKVIDDAAKAAADQKVIDDAATREMFMATPGGLDGPDPLSVLRDVEFPDATSDRPFRYHPHEALNHETFGIWAVFPGEDSGHGFGVNVTSFSNYTVKIVASVEGIMSDGPLDGLHGGDGMATWNGDLIAVDTKRLHPVLGAAQLTMDLSSLESLRVDFSDLYRTDGDGGRHTEPDLRYVLTRQGKAWADPSGAAAAGFYRVGDDPAGVVAGTLDDKGRHLIGAFGAVRE